MQRPIRAAEEVQSSDVQRRVMRQRQFLEETKPYVDLKTKIYSLAAPTIIIYDDGRMETKYNFSPETEKTLQLIDSAIEAVRLKYLGA